MKSLFRTISLENILISSGSCGIYATFSESSSIIFDKLTENFCSKSEHLPYIIFYGYT